MVVVITGATRGIGYGMAEEFLARGHRVAVCGRSEERLRAAVERLAAKFGSGSIGGQVCDVGECEQVAALWAFAVARFGRVDTWINNAGQTPPRGLLWTVTPSQMRDAVVTNVVGTLNGSNVAIGGMLDQGGGTIWNMEGLGSDGSIVSGLAVYGATKSAVTYLTRALVRELKGTPVKAGFLSPGIVLTDLFVGEKMDDATRRIGRILGDRVGVVAPFLVARMLSNPRHGARIAWLTRGKILKRFVRAAVRLTRADAPV